MRLLALALAFALLGAATPSPAPTGDATAPVSASANYDAFGFALLAKLALRSPRDNTFLSPVSIGVALSMAADGAAGATRAAILKTLEAGDDVDAANAALTRELATNTGAEVGLANALWLREDVPPSPSYVAQLESVYGAKTAALHFGDPAAAATINAWTKDHTLGLIPHLIDTTSGSDVMYLTNALAFTGRWTVPFKKSGTSDGTFTSASGAKQTVDMMSQRGTFKYAAEAGFKALRMPYGEGGYAAYILLPEGENATSLVASLGRASFTKTLNDLTDTNVRVEVPRFTATYRTSLVEQLRALGMAVAFSPSADFSKIRNAPPRLAISAVEHASYLHVDELGTTAAAATAVGIVALAMRPMPATDFIVDHPFVFVIRDERAGTLLFAGVMNSLV